MSLLDPADDIHEPLTTKEGWARFIDTPPVPPEPAPASDPEAYEDARLSYHSRRGIVRRWCERGSYREHRDRRIAALGEHGTIIDWENPAFEAACYHGVICLTEFLVSPDLIARGIAAKPGNPSHILAQVGRRIGCPDFAPYGAYDPSTDGSNI